MTIPIINNVNTSKAKLLGKLIKFENIDLLLPVPEEITNENRKSFYAQAYLLLATTLEVFKKEKSNLNIIQDLNVTGTVTINDIILYFYEKSFSFGNHTDFPFFQFYNFLQTLSLDELKGLKLNDNYQEIRTIYIYLFKDKNEHLQRKQTLNQTISLFSKANKSKFVVVNKGADFVAQGEPYSISIMDMIAQLIYSELDKIETVEKYTSEEILYKFGPSLKNQALIELLSELKTLDILQLLNHLLMNQIE